MKRRISDLVDIDRFATMMRSFYEATGIPHGLIDIDNTVLSGIGWQDICTRFHRPCAAAVRRCHDSDHFIANHLQAGRFVGYKCGNGLMDYAAPIIIDGEHLATMFLGQLLHEPPDVEFFRGQAKDFGFDEQAYLEALTRVPIVSRERVESAMTFFSQLAQMLAVSGKERLRHLEVRQEVAMLNFDLAQRVECRTRELAQVNEALTQEIEEQRRAQRDLCRQRDFSQAIIDSLPGIFYLLDDQGRLTLWNHNLETLLGYTAAELDHFPAIEFFRGADRVRVADRIAQVFADGRADVEAAIVTKDGRAIPHALTGLRIDLGDGPSLLGVGLDITERLAAEQSREDKAAALARSNAELEQFAYVASHDLREPLRMINSYVTLLERRYGNQLGQDAHDFIAFAREGAVRIDHLVLDLLEYSRVGRGGTPLEPVDCAEAVRQAIANLRLAIDEAGAKISADQPPASVLAAPDELTRLFQNLIGNAIKYRKPDRAPEIHVGCERRPTDLLFHVSDNGIGISREYHDRIFMIFQRLHGRKDYPGNGIGLAICKKIVERYGGNIWVESEPDMGSTFFFTLAAPAT